MVGGGGLGRAITTRAHAAWAALRGSGAETRHAIRVTAAALAAFLLYHLFNLPQGYWAVFTVVIVMQASIGGTLSASIDRMKGTLAGAAIGAVAATLRPPTPFGAGAALCVSVALATWLAAARPSLKVAPVTAVIMLVSPSATLGPLDAAALRVVEIAIGSVIGVGATLLIFPARSSALMAARVRASLERMADMMRTFAAGLGPDSPPPDDEAIHARHAELRAALGEVEAAMSDAIRERDTHLGAHAISDAVPRTLWRIRNDCVTVGRALQPFPAELTGTLGAPAAALMRGQAVFMRACGDALVAGAAVERARQTDGLADFEAAVAEARASGRTRGLSFDAVGHVFTLSFSLESVARNLGDLADRIDEAADPRRAAPMRAAPK